MSIPSLVISRLTYLSFVTISIHLANTSRSSASSLQRNYLSFRALLLAVIVVIIQSLTASLQLEKKAKDVQDVKIIEIVFQSKAASSEVIY